MPTTNKITQNPLEADIAQKIKGGRTLWDLVRFYSVPLTSLVFFLAILVTQIFPSLNNIFTNLNQLQEFKEKVSVNQREINNLANLKQNSTAVSNDLLLINNIVPSEKTKIVSMQADIENLAIANKLTIEKFQTGESLAKLIEDEQNAVKAATSVTASASANGIVNSENSLRIAPTNVEMKGQFIDIQNFLSGLYAKKTLFIIRSMDFSTQGEVNTADPGASVSSWEIKITFAKYSFSENFLQNPESFSQIPSNTTADAKTLEFLRSRFGGAPAAN